VDGGERDRVERPAGPERDERARFEFADVPGDSGNGEDAAEGIERVGDPGERVERVAEW
jgi:hypothetical protein